MTTSTPRSHLSRFALGYLEVIPDAYRATLHGADLGLSPTQVDVLSALVANHGRVVTRHELADAAGIDTGSVDVVLSGIRRVLGPRAVRNVRSRGWIIEAGVFQE